MNKHFKFISLVLSIVFCFSAIAFGQETTGSIEGTIRDPNDAVIPGVSVNVKSVGNTVGFNRTVTTDENGYFVVPNIPVGNYTVTISEAKGFKGVTTDTTVVLGKASQINTKLETGTGTTIVDVTAEETAVLDPTESKLTTNITKQVIDALPKGTNFTSLLKTAPNVRPEPLAAGFQIDGASGAENVFIIDGQEVTNFRTGQLNTSNNIPFELVQEVQIKSTGFEAEYGGATGGVINVVTAGGNDRFRGNFGISFVPSKLQGGARPILSRFNNTSTGFEYFKMQKDGGTSFFPTGSLSGPLIKGKLWLSGAYAPQIFEINENVPYFIDSTVDALGRNNPNADPAVRRLGSVQNFQFKRKSEEALVRLDAQPSSKIRAYGTFLYNPVIDKGALPGYNSGLTSFSTVNPFGPVFDQSQLLNNQGGRQNSNSVNGQVTYTPTNHLVFNFRAGRSFLNEKLGSYGIPAATRTVCSASGNPAAVPGSGCSIGFTNFPNNFQIPFDVSTRRTFDADASLIGVNIGGRHNFKFGYQYNGIANTTNQGYRDQGVITLFYALSIDNLTGQRPTGATASNPSGFCAAGQTTNCNLGSGQLQRFQTNGKASSKSQGFFAQDSWTINNRLTLNLGIRAEIENVPSFNSANPGIKFNLGDKIAPRLGFAYDPFGKGTTKIFGSYGWFYDRFKYELPRGSFGGDFFRRDYFEILPSRGANYTSYTRANILGTVADIPGGNCPSATPVSLGNGYSVCQFDFRVPSNKVGGDINDSGAVDPNLKAARQSEYTFGVEQQAFKTYLFSARYTQKKIDRAVEDIGFPNTQGSEAYIIGNPGFGLACEQAKLNGFGCTKAQRDYRAFEVRVDKRLKDNYFFNLSYTRSRLFGNYSGLASSDEAGRSSPNVNRFFDLPFLGYDALGRPDNGLLATDRPNVFKGYAGYIFNWFGSKTNSTDVSVFTSVQSGTPLTTQYSFYSATAILNKRGDLGRTHRFSETDLLINHSYKFGRDNRFTLQPFVNFRNLFDQKNELTRQTQIAIPNFTAGTLAAAGCTACTSELTAIRQVFNGGIQQFINARIAASPATRQFNTYNLANSFQLPREVRFGARFFF
jgi:Carboxypeptidase regulatory-like domain/TonB-dependent Receptor Plug Domain/TonB dependent receptor